MKEEELGYFQSLTKKAIAESSQEYLRKLVLESKTKHEKFRAVMNKHLNLKIVQKSEVSVGIDRE